jgi:hypothetical protein
MENQIEKAINLVVEEFLKGKDPSEYDEKGKGMYWDLSREFALHYQAEIGEKVEPEEMIYYALHDVTGFLFKRFAELLGEVMGEMGGDFQ